jgi:hypothetical protein
LRTAVRQRGEALHYATPQFIASSEFPLFIGPEVARGLSLCHIPEAAMTKEICHAAVMRDGLELKHVPDEHRYIPHELRSKKRAQWTPAEEQMYFDQMELTMQAVMQNGRALAFADDFMKQDAELVRAAVQQDGLALQFASQSRRGDPSIAALAVQRDPTAIKWVPAELHNDRDFMLVCCENARVMQFLSSELRTDREFMVECMQRNGRAVKHYPSAAYQATPSNGRHFGRAMEQLEPMMGIRPFWTPRLKRSQHAGSSSKY